MEIKCQLDTTEVFIADLIDCSTCFGHHFAHHQELKSIIQWLLPVVFRAVVFSSSWSGVELRIMRPVYRILVYWLWFVACMVWVTEGQMKKRVRVI